MLPLAAQRRLLRALPEYVDLRHDGEYRRYRFEKWWARQDFEVNYPSAVLDLNPTGVLRESDQPLNDILRVDSAAEGADIPGEYAHRILRGHRLYDELSITCTAQGSSAGISADERAMAIADRMARFLRFGVGQAGLDEPGEGHNEIPILVPTSYITGPADQSDAVSETDVARYVVSARVFYTLTQVELVDAVADVEIDSPISIAVEYDHDAGS